MMGFDAGDGNRKPVGEHILKLDHMPTYHTRDIHKQSDPILAMPGFLHTFYVKAVMMLQRPYLWEWEQNCFDQFVSFTGKQGIVGPSGLISI